MKQTIIIRKDLKMRRGKEISQGSHASSMFMRDILLNNKQLTEKQKMWLETDYTKITLSVDSEQELLDLHQKAQDAGIMSYIVTDIGKTEFNGVPTITALAIGPDEPDLINPLTSHLKLL